MKTIIMTFALFLVSNAAVAATQTIPSNAVISADYARDVQFRGDYFGFTTNRRKTSVLLRLRNSNFSSPRESFLAVSFDGAELLDINARHPLVGGDRLTVNARCKGPNHFIHRLDQGQGASIYAYTCKLVSVVVTTPDVPVSVVVAPAEIEKLPPSNLPIVISDIPPAASLPASGDVSSAAPAAPTVKSPAAPVQAINSSLPVQVQIQPAAPVAQVYQPVVRQVWPRRIYEYER